MLQYERMYEDAHAYTYEGAYAHMLQYILVRHLGICVERISFNHNIRIMLHVTLYLYT